MTVLLDVNVLIALVDPAHVHHSPVNLWFEQEGRTSWATCPITENGLLRIIGHPGYGNSPGSPAAVAPLLIQLRSLDGHVFWSDDISLVAAEGVDPYRLLGHGQITDTYLLGLARSKGGRLATLDRRLLTSAVNGGLAALHVIPA